jgi:hypothetical protein
MYGITLHYTDTEEIMGTVIPLVYPEKFPNAPAVFDEVYRTFKMFNEKYDDFGELDDPIEDFVEFHNDNSELPITSMAIDYIQL